MIAEYTAERDQSIIEATSIWESRVNRLIEYNCTVAIKAAIAQQSQCRSLENGPTSGACEVCTHFDVRGLLLIVFRSTDTLQDPQRCEAAGDCVPGSARSGEQEGIVPAQVRPVAEAQAQNFPGDYSEPVIYISSAGEKQRSQAPNMGTLTTGERSKGMLYLRLNDSFHKPNERC